MLNVLPIDDIEHHEEDTTCKCNPTVVEEGGEMIVIHNSFDGRECVEMANKILGQ